jgi:DNA helicase HerA-like ATPase
MHTGYYGVTLTGKTTLARLVARNLAKEGHKGAVFDPTLTATLGGGWPEGWPVFTDPDDFLDFVESDKCVGPIHLFIDEADEVFGHEMKWNFWLLKKGRHFGYFCHVISQRPKMIAPTARSQCALAYVFRLAVEDVAEIGKDYGHSGLDRISLDTGEFLALKSGTSAISRGNVFKLAS